MTILLYHINYIDKDDETVKTLRLSSKRYRTAPGDTPASTAYQDKILQAGEIEQHLYTPGRTLGPSEVGFGQLVVSNADGELDYLRGQGFSLQDFEILTVASETAALSTATSIFNGTVEQVFMDWTSVRFVLRDALADVDQPIATEVFAGTNSAADDYEGESTTIQGQTKPFVEGKVRHIQPPLCNLTSQLFCTSFDSSGVPEAATIDAVYVNFLELTLDTTATGSTSGDYATITALTTAQTSGHIAAGQYATCNAAGAFCISTTLAAGEIVTADVTRTDTTAADIVENIIVNRLGLPSSRVDSTTFGQLNTDQGADMGIYVDTERSGLSVISEIMSGIGAHFRSCLCSTFKVGILEAATGTPVRTYDSSEIIAGRDSGLQKVEVSDQGEDGIEGLPFKKVTVAGQKIWRVFSDTEFAGAVTLANREYGKLEYRRREAEATNSIANVHAGAGTLEIISLLDDLTEIQNEANRQRTLRQVQRDIWIAPVEFDGTLHPLGSEITLDITRFGYTSGINGIILGTKFELANNIVRYYLWV